MQHATVYSQFPLKLCTISPVNPLNLKKKGRVIKSLKLALVSDCNDSCFEVCIVDKHNKCPTFLRRATSDPEIPPGKKNTLHRIH